MLLVDKIIKNKMQAMLKHNYQGTNSVHQSTVI